MTTINTSNPFSNDRQDTEFYIEKDLFEKPLICHGCEGAVGITWTSDEAREAARRLILMADEIDHVTKGKVLWRRSGAS